MSETRELTFEHGYQRLQTIAGRLAEEEVPVSEMCDLFAEGKGLEKALTSYLDEQRSRVDAIEAGEGIQAFKIAATAPDRNKTTSSFEPVSTPLPAAGDDIPF